MSNPSVLQIVDSFLPVIGGKQLVVHWLTTHLNNAGFETNVFASGIGANNNFERNYSISRFPRRPRTGRIPRNTAVLLMNRIKHRPALLHAHSAFPAGLYAVLSKKIRNIPVVITCTGEDVLKVPEIGYGESLNSKTASKIEYALRGADALIAISEGMKEILIEWGVSEDKIHFIPNGIDLERFSVNEEHAIEKSNNKTLLAIGKYRRVKGFEEFLQTSAFVIKEEPDANATIIGDGMEHLNNLITDLNLGDKLDIQEESFDYNKEDLEDKLKNSYNSSGVYISSSLSESFSITILESMAMGLPVVSTATPGAKGLIVHEETGLLSPVGDVQKLAENVLRVFRDKELRAKLIKNALKKSKNYSWEKVTRMHINLYEQLLKKKI